MSLNAHPAPLPRILRAPRDVMLMALFIAIATWPLVIAIVVVRGLLRALF